MVDIQSTAAEIRRGKKKRRRKKKEITGQKYNGLPYYTGDHNYQTGIDWYKTRKSSCTQSCIPGVSA